jgi:DNA topoisomerase I
MTTLERLQATGIKRLGNPERGFRYQSANGGKVSLADRQRIYELRIPPAWTNVAINSTPNGRVQAVGTDAAGRWQYLYHGNHTRTQESRKFRRIVKFAEALPKMRRRIAQDLKQTGLARERVLASILRVLSSCFLRPGSHVYASEHGSYGISTLRPKHVTVKADVIEFDFPGKSGVQQTRQIRDRQVAKVIRALLKRPGQVFKYENGNGLLVKIERRHINEYIKEVMGEKFSAKDFRTWAGTLICAAALARVGIDENDTTTSRKRKMVSAIKETAEILGNTPAVCRGSYICPEILNGFEQGRVITEHFNKPDDFMSFRGRNLHRAETSLLKFLKKAAK